MKIDGYVSMFEKAHGLNYPPRREFSFDSKGDVEGIRQIQKVNRDGKAVQESE